MLNNTRTMLELVDMLPEVEQNFINEMIKRVVLAWDPEFTKLTTKETKSMEIAEKELSNKEYLTHEEVWSE